MWGKSVLIVFDDNVVSDGFFDVANNNYVGLSDADSWIHLDSCLKSRPVHQRHTETQIRICCKVHVKLAES
jgi:hypothetical protein